MSNSEKYMAILAELNRGFDFFNLYFCEGQLKKPIITVGSYGRNHLGHFAPGFWVEDGKLVGESEGETPESEGEKTLVRENEINISADALNRAPEAVFETLLHEMAHLKNHQDGKKDCNQQGRHNKLFKGAAEHFGLCVEKHPTRGWATTSLTSISTEAIEKFKPDSTLFGIFRSVPKIKKENDHLTIVLSRARMEDKLLELLELTGEKKKEMISVLIEKHWESFREE